MNTKIIKFIGFSALTSLFVGFSALAAPTIGTVENVSITPAADKVVLKALPAGFYQFNNLEIFKGPSVDEPPATIEVIQKNDKNCVVYENGKTDQPIACIFEGNQNNNFIVQIDERTTILGANQEPALLTDFAAGDKVNVLGWLSADSTTIRAAILRNLESKNFHQSLSGTIKKVSSDGFTIVLDSGDEVFVETPIVEGAQVTIKGVFDKVNNVISNALSIIVKPTMVYKETEPETPLPATPSAKPSTLFKNFLKVFGL